MKNLTVLTAFFFAFIFTTSTDLFARIVVESMKGETAYKKGNQWLPLTKGMLLQEGTKISTGVRSWAVLNIDGDTLRIQQLTLMEIFSNQVTAKNKNTHIGLKHGTLKARVGKIGTLKTSFKISTPVATSSVRGTEQENKQGYKLGNLIHVPSGLLEVEDKNGGTYLIEGNAAFHISPNDPRPQNLLSNARKKSLVAIMDPNSTSEEKKSLELSGLDNFTKDNNPGIQNRPSLPATVILQVGW